VNDLWLQRGVLFKGFQELNPSLIWLTEIKSKGFKRKETKSETKGKLLKVLN